MNCNEVIDVDYLALGLTKTHPSDRLFGLNFTTEHIWVWIEIWRKFQNCLIMIMFVPDEVFRLSHKSSERRKQTSVNMYTGTFINCISGKWVITPNCLNLTSTYHNPERYSIFKTTRSFRYQCFRVSTLQANANKPFIWSNMKRTTGGGHLEKKKNISRWPPPVVRFMFDHMNGLLAFAWRVETRNHW